MYISFWNLFFLYLRSPVGFSHQQSKSNAVQDRCLGSFALIYFCILYPLNVHLRTSHELLSWIIYTAWFPSMMLDFINSFTSARLPDGSLLPSPSTDILFPVYSSLHLSWTWNFLAKGSASLISRKTSSSCLSSVAAFIVSSVEFRVNLWLTCTFPLTVFLFYLQK